MASRNGLLKLIQILIELGGADPRIIGDKGNPYDVADANNASLKDYLLAVSILESPKDWRL